MEEDKLHIICITLESSERHQHMLSKLNKISNITYEFIFGKEFDDKFIDKWPYKTNIEWKKSMFSNQPKYLNHAYSCADAHIRANKRIIELNKWCLIIEDDCELPNNINDTCQLILNTYHENFYHLATEAYYYYIGRLKKLEDKISLRILNHANSTMAYLANPIFSKNYIKTNNDIKYPSDLALFYTPIFDNKFPLIFGTKIKFDEDQKISTIGIN